MTLSLSESAEESRLARARRRWSQVGGRAGLGVALLGFLVIAFAWDGAAELDYAQGQLPYLLSGGFGGLGLVVLGAALVVADGHRRDRAALEQRLAELTDALRAANPEPPAANLPAPRPGATRTAKKTA